VERTGKAQDARAVVAHEAIPRFADRDGRAAVMPAMTMAFGIGPDVDASALVPDSKWELTFQVHWNREPTLLITAAKALPRDAQLALEPLSK
jgi:hypothetical protein